MMASVEALSPCLQAHLATHYARLHRRLTRYLGCAELASDSLHDAWLRLAGKPAPPASSMDAYVCRVACNLAVDRLRQARPWHYADGAEAVLEQLADGAAGPATLAEVRSELAAVDRAVACLPRRHRQVLFGLRLEDATRDEVAARHGISLRSVDTLLRQALDHCAAQTGQTVIGGIGTARRALRTARAGFQPGPPSFAVAS